LELGPDEEQRPRVVLEQVYPMKVVGVNPIQRARANLAHDHSVANAALLDISASQDERQRPAPWVIV
jgi:hypothetical protein